MAREEMRETGSREAKRPPGDNGRTREEMQQVSHEIQHATHQTADAAARSLSEVTNGLERIALEWTEFSNKAVQENMQTLQQLFGARSLGQLMEAQAQFASRAVDRNLSGLTRLTEIYLATIRKAAEPVRHEQQKS